MSLLAVDNEHRVPNLIGVLQNRLIHKGLASDHIPAAVGIQRTLMIAALCLVIVIIIFHKERRVFRERIDDTAAQLVLSGFQVFKSLRAHSRSVLISGFLAVLAVKIAFLIYSCHIVHSRRDRRLDSCIEGSSVQGHAAPSADTEDAYAIRINIFIQRQEIHCCHEIFRIDIRGCHVSYVSAALTCEGRVKRDCQEASLRQRLGVQSRALFLDRSERTAYRNCGELSLSFLRHVHISCKGDSVTVYKCDLAVLHLIALRERLVPLCYQVQFFFFKHAAFPPLCQQNGFPLLFLISFSVCLIRKSR